MKTILKLSLAILLISKLYSCTLPENVEPDYLSEVARLLPELQQNTAYFRGMDITRYQLIWMQQLGGVSGNDFNVDGYIMESNFVQGAWENYYKIIHPKIINSFNYSYNAEVPAYMGISRLLFAINMGILTDSWGDVPFDQAIGFSQGFLIIPYNTQEKIYQWLLEMVDLAIEDLDTAIADNSIKPQSNDLFYSGNLSKWKRAANVLKLRFKLRLAHKNNTYNELVDLVNDSQMFLGNTDDMFFVYSGNEQNPFYYNDNVTRNSRVGHFLVEKLQSTNDPRLPVFVAKAAGTDDYIGSQPGDANLGASYIGSGLASVYSPSNIITFVEQKFIEAEIFQRAGQQTQADQAFEQAVKAALNNYGVGNPAWESQHAEIENVTLEQIINAKYVALFLNPEVWSDFRRTGFPTLEPYFGTVIPRRFLYPLGEELYNSANVPPGVNIFSRVWWDSL